MRNSAWICQTYLNYAFCLVKMFKDILVLNFEINLKVHRMFQIKEIVNHKKTYNNLKFIIFI